jgi:hypothetical protein
MSDMPGTYLGAQVAFPEAQGDKAVHMPFLLHPDEGRREQAGSQSPGKSCGLRRVWKSFRGSKENKLGMDVPRLQSSMMKKS